jgi:hypothetical protein
LQPWETGGPRSKSQSELRLFWAFCRYFSNHIIW